MEPQLKSVATPSASPLSRKITVDYSKVPIDEIQAEVTARVKKYLGSDYNVAKRKITKSLKDIKVKLIHVEIAFLMVGIEGGMTILMMVQEWKLADRIIDFQDKMDEFLEAYIEENK